MQLSTTVQQLCTSSVAKVRNLTVTLILPIVLARSSSRHNSDTISMLALKYVCVRVCLFDQFKHYLSVLIYLECVM